MRLICCYNAKSNDPYKDVHHPRYTPLKKVPDSAIKKSVSSSFPRMRQTWLGSIQTTTQGLLF